MKNSKISGPHFLMLSQCPIYQHPCDICRYSLGSMGPSTPLLEERLLPLLDQYEVKPPFYITIPLHCIKTKIHD